MSCLGNIIWFIFGGFINSIMWFIFGVVWCCTIIGIPIGIQCFKIAKLQLAPFGREVIWRRDTGTNLILNIIWIITGGFYLCIMNLFSAFLLSISIVGIPFASQALKLAKLSLMPFGREIR
ncbi:MAG: YccF domain-containing protein [Clostridium sp.]|nr:YccF domain-containing protein [Clostridium sp.]